MCDLCRSNGSGGAELIAGRKSDSNSLQSLGHLRVKQEEGVEAVVGVARGRHGVVHHVDPKVGHSLMERRPPDARRARTVGDESPALKVAGVRELSTEAWGKRTWRMHNLINSE